MEEKDLFQKMAEWFVSLFISDEDEEDPGVLSESEAEAISPYEKAVLRYEISEDTDIVVFDPVNLDETELIGKLIRSSKAVCVNLHKIPDIYRQRVIDFLNGVIYGVDGSIKKIGENVYLCTPKELLVAGDIHTSGED